MAKIVSQETFDDVVKENVIDFSMTPQEAKDETVKQFEAQGVNLANIIKDLAINDETGVPIINESLDKLKKHISGEEKLDFEQLKKNLEILEAECKKSVPHRVLAAKNGAHEILLSILNDELSNESNDISNNATVTATSCNKTSSSSSSSNSSDSNDNNTITNNNLNSENEIIILHCLLAANSLTNQQPDIFDAEALSSIIKILQKYKTHTQIICATLKWMGKACIMHEMNRQNIVTADILKYLKPLIFLKDEKIIRNVCIIFRYLVLDDDIRVEFGKAHEHARTIASEVLIDLTKLLPEYDDINVLCDLILTIASLTVRHEFCMAVAEAEGLKQVLQLITKYPDSVRLNREALKLLRALAGHDTVKSHIVQQGVAPIIHDILINHKSNDTIVAAALVCISTLTLRNRDNSLEFFKVNIPEPIIEVVRLYPKNKVIQRNASWAIRNLVSRLREYNESFLALGAEDLLNEAIKEHPSIQQDVNAALRDLGCRVQLREEWTGKAEKKITN